MPRCGWGRLALEAKTGLSPTAAFAGLARPVMASGRVYSNSSLSRLSRAVARPETKDWVCRAPDPSDGRYTLASLTDRGREKVEQATPGHVDLVSRLIFDSLTPTQTRQLHNISVRITSAIRADGSWQP